MAVAELMRILLDEAGLGWDEAWDLTRRTLAYTNHTLMPEALETWPVSLFEIMVPRLLEIIYEINRRFLDDVRARFPGDPGRLARVSLIAEGPEKRVRMANLAIVGTPQHQRRGRDPLAAAPDDRRRRPGRDLPRAVQQQDQRRDPQALAAPGQPRPVPADHRRDRRRLDHRPDPAQEDRPPGRRRRIPRRLPPGQTRGQGPIRRRGCGTTTGLAVDPDTIFDSQVKRIHEYKRQLLNILHVIILYNRLRDNPKLDVPPRTFFFAGKAAPAYTLAKLIIKLINNVATVVNVDPVIERQAQGLLPDRIQRQPRRSG